MAPVMLKVEWLLIGHAAIPKESELGYGKWTALYSQNLLEIPMCPEHSRVSLRLRMHARLAIYIDIYIYIFLPMYKILRELELFQLQPGSERFNWSGYYNSLIKTAVRARSGQISAP